MRINTIPYDGWYTKERACVYGEGNAGDIFVLDVWTPGLFPQLPGLMRSSTMSPCLPLFHSLYHGRGGLDPTLAKTKDRIPLARVPIPTVTRTRTPVHHPSWRTRLAGVVYGKKKNQVRAELYFSKTLRTKTFFRVNVFYYVVILSEKKKILYRNVRDIKLRSEFLFPKPPLLSTRTLLGGSKNPQHQVQGGDSQLPKFLKERHQHTSVVSLPILKTRPGFLHLISAHQIH